MIEVTEEDACPRRVTRPYLISFLLALLVIGMLLISGAVETPVDVHYSESHAYACGVIAGQQMTLDRWDENDDCREVRLRAVANGLSSMRRPRDN